MKCFDIPLNLSINRENDGDLESDVNPLEAPKGNYVIVEEEDVVVLNRDTFAHYVKPKVNPYMKVKGCLSVCTDGFSEPLNRYNSPLQGSSS